MQISYISPHDLTPYPNNTKLHPHSQLEKIAESIKLTGFDQPIVVDKDHVIIKGHGRRQVAIAEGLETVPVVVVDVSADVARAARILDNKSAESDWDLEALEAELDALSESGLETGFYDGEIDELRELEKQIEDEYDPTDFDPVDAETQPRLDELKPIKCPNCGHEFQKDG